MKRCLVIINRQSGKAKKIKEAELSRYLGCEYALTFDYLTENSGFEGYDAVAVCGGDGTLSTVLARIQNQKVSLIYFPFGTVNDRARSDKDKKSVIIGNLNDKSFSYVAACGTFTPIGYTTDIRRKKRYRAFAYFWEAVKQFKIHRIKATIDNGSKLYKGEYTLIMLIKSRCCFYFNFNKLYDKDSLTAHLLLIKSPKRSGLIGYITLFLRFFRVFFIGLRRYTDGKIVFQPFENLKISLQEPCAFCVDGERYIPDNTISVQLKRANPILEIIPPRTLKCRRRTAPLCKE